MRSGEQISSGEYQLKLLLLSTTRLSSTWFAATPTGASSVGSPLAVLLSRFVFAIILCALCVGLARADELDEIKRDVRPHRLLEDELGGRQVRARWQDYDRQLPDLRPHTPGRSGQARHPRRHPTLGTAVSMPTSRLRTGGHCLFRSARTQARRVALASARRKYRLLRL